MDSSKTPNTNVTLDTLIAFCKRRGFVYQSAEIYGGINGFYDYGHLGNLLLNNIRHAWITSLETASDKILFFDGSLITPSAVWQASGHLENFQDPLVDCTSCKKRYRADEIDLEKACPHCGKKAWTPVRQFNMMLKTQIGAAADLASEGYLRPETAQSIFINFKNIISTNRISIPFGVAQIGKAFRNEINPKQFLFRVREFEQMELEWFCKPETALADFEFWRTHRFNFYQKIGIKKEHIRLRNHEKSELAHYSRATSDIEYFYPFGWKEIEGIAYRTDFDLRQHSTLSGKDLSVFDEATKQSYIPHVVECSVGTGRLFLTVLFDAYEEQTVDDEPRVVLHLHPSIAPIKAAFFPLTKKQIEAMEQIYQSIRKKGFSVQFDDSGSIGKRYRRQDEIGTPVCFTFDFESEQTQTVTVRDRDTMQQTRINTDQIETYIKDLLTRY
jgi:glycyl-tRNA synthetase